MPTYWLMGMDWNICTTSACIVNSTYAEAKSIAPRGKPTGGDLVVVRGRPVQENVLDLEEFVGPVSSDDGEPEALGAFSERSLQDGALQLRRISCEDPRSPARLLCCREERGERLTRDNKSKETVSLDRKTDILTQSSPVRPCGVGLDEMVTRFEFEIIISLILPVL
ncbi:hypothetical protein EYF80_059774 [Liparis tanakae]|uniref:Uncharacterized protein n=1 Tax=Liparis tanakae TaxID=230148 RepID=A0A4Z2EMG3_9TELE|nr:hypothetical protein EYF80_059774 [Liparis tanakae]